MHSDQNNEVSAIDFAHNDVDLLDAIHSQSTSCEVSYIDKLCMYL